MKLQHAIVKFNGGRGAILCNNCHTILMVDIHPYEVEDRTYYCIEVGRPCCKAYWNAKEVT
jgi:hypothetical protein